jgi:hypothetical protein
VKIILDCEPADMGAALNVAFRVQQQYPDQKTGGSGAVIMRTGGVDFAVIKNQESYTVKAV